MAIPVEEKVPALMDLQVLSPIAWVRREATRLQAIDGDPNYEPHDYIGVILDRACQADGIAKVGPPYSDDDRRRLEHSLIQIATHAVLWIEDLRRGDYTPKTVKEPTK